MSWICKQCETENPDRLNVCEVCGTPREYSPVDKLKKKLKEKYGNSAYSSFIRYHSDLLELADNGDVNAQYQVGEWFFDHGKGKPSDAFNYIAVYWYLKASNGGHIVAQFKLASCYEEGIGVTKSYDEALKWYEKASCSDPDNSLYKSKYLRLKYNSGTYDSVIKYKINLLEKADGGHRYSQYMLGGWFKNHDSNPLYKNEAFFWYSKSANQGLPAAMRMMGECYEMGIGVNNNSNKATSWYKRAAIEGDRPSCLKLAHSYLYGKMVKKDVKEALKWFDNSGVDMTGDDLCNIGYAYDVGDTVVVDKVKAVDYYRKAADKGNVVAEYNLGICYENGNGVIKDINIARYWYQNACNHGYNNAYQCLSRVNSLIESQKRDDFIVKCIVSLIVGAAYGGMGYYVLTELLPNWGIIIPEVWPNSYPTNLMSCLVIGVVCTYLFTRW